MNGNPFVVQSPINAQNLGQSFLAGQQMQANRMKMQQAKDAQEKARLAAQKQARLGDIAKNFTITTPDGFSEFNQEGYINAVRQEFGPIEAQKIRQNFDIAEGKAAKGREEVTAAKKSALDLDEWLLGKKPREQAMIETGKAPDFKSEKAMEQAKDLQELAIQRQNQMFNQQQRALIAREERMQEKEIDKEYRNVLNEAKRGFSGDKAKVMAAAKDIDDGIPELKKILSGDDWRSKALGISLGTNREGKKLLLRLTDSYGRLKSGGAINKDEESRFDELFLSAKDALLQGKDSLMRDLDALQSYANYIKNKTIPPIQLKSEADAEGLPPGIPIILNGRKGVTQ